MSLCETQPGRVARQGTFISFWGADPNPKTARFRVLTTEGAVNLGAIQWHGAWRCYAFFPEPDTLFEPKCLGEIQQFLLDLMAERRK